MPAKVVRLRGPPELPLAPERKGLPELVDELPPVREGVASRLVVELAAAARALGAGWDSLAGTAAGGDAGVVVVVAPPRGGRVGAGAVAPAPPPRPA